MTTDKHHHHAGHTPTHPKRRHIQWISLIVVGLMLLAMLLYIFSGEETDNPAIDNPPVEVVP
ncbi:MAG: hypothetical protein ACK4RK_19975 [Gemmataceae bacterium]